MHISEGVLSIPVLSAGALVAAAGLAIGMKKVTPRQLPKVALLTAAFFVASLVHVPIGPSNAHLVLNGLLGILLGWAAFPAIFIGLVLQAVLFQFGGLTTLGVNTANMAVPGVFFGLLARRFISLERPWASALAAGAAGGASVLSAGFLVALCLSLSGESFGVAAKLIFTAHIPIAAVEAVISGFVIRFLLRVRPEMVGCKLKDTLSMKRHLGQSLVLFMLLGLLFPGSCRAHRVNVFAWYDGKYITGKAYYSNGRPASGAELLIKRKESPQTFRLKTENNGEFAFAPPSPGSYLLVLKAGQGHLARTTVKVANSDNQAEKRTGQETAAGGMSTQETGALSAKPVKKKDVGQGTLVEVGCSDLEQVMDSVLERRLEPIRRELEALVVSQGRVRMRDVLSGLGYIAGIMGLWAYLSSKKGE